MVVEDAPTALSNAAPEKNGTLTALALGNFWFPEKQGGLDRIFMELQRHLPSAKITMRGLVLGSERAPVDTEGMVTAFAPTDAPMFKRMRHVEDGPFRHALEAQGVPTQIMQASGMQGVRKGAGLARCPLFSRRRYVCGSNLSHAS